MKLRILSLLVIIVVCFHTFRAWESSDRHLRYTVYKLFADSGSCTGVKVFAPSGKAYVLTAGHCASLLKDGTVKATTEDGVEYTLNFIEEDPYSDLLLLSAPVDGPAVSVAKQLERHEHVHTLTHGRGYPTYRTDGEAVATDVTTVPTLRLTNPNDIVKCSSPKYTIITTPFGDRACAVVTVQLISTASLIPGSSGGPLFNAEGQLAGIASATDDKFAAFVTLSDIGSFLKGR